MQTAWSNPDKERDRQLPKAAYLLLSRVIEPKIISSQSLKIRLSFRYSFMKTECFLPILQNRRAKGLTRLKNWVSLNYGKKKISDQNSNYLVKTECNPTFDFKNQYPLVKIRANLEVGTSKKLKFSKFDLTP